MQPQAQVLVTLTAEGQITLKVQGDKLTALGMLDVAKYTLLSQPAQQTPPILLARGNLPNGK